LKSSGGTQKQLDHPPSRKDFTTGRHVCRRISVTKANPGDNRIRKNGKTKNETHFANQLLNLNATFGVVFR
jgi:hypothetical protein